DALTIQQIEAKPFRVTPLAPPPRPLGPRMPASLLGRASAVGTRRHIGSIDAQHHHRTAQAGAFGDSYASRRRRRYRSNTRSRLHPTSWARRDTAPTVH